MTDQKPLTEQQLDDIETRAAHLDEYATLTDVPLQADADQLTGEDVPALLAEVRLLRTVAADLAARWEKEAAATQHAIDVDPLGGDVEAAQHERVRIYQESARDLREVLATGRIPDDLLTPADAATP